MCFHGNYDFAYFLRNLLNENLPASRDQFDTLLESYFPKLLDIKSFIHLFVLEGGLNRLADQLNVRRVGTMHQGGSDSLVTVQVFFKLFSNCASAKEKEHLRSIMIEYNQNIYGYANDQAFTPLGPSR